MLEPGRAAGERPLEINGAVSEANPGAAVVRAVPDPAVFLREPRDAHVPALDGVRGLAIVLVILHHGIQAWGPSRPGLEQLWKFVAGHAWVGVDLFFVLSGFLITGILLDTKGRRRYFGSFYPRRMLRTFPLYYATILVCLVLLPALPLAAVEGMRQLSERQGWFWLHVSNFYTLAHNIAAQDGPAIGWMATFWSLAVEEHFYLVWPLVVYCCSRKGVLRACVGLLVACLVLRIVFLAQGRGFQYVYYHTLTRLDGLLLGSLVAALHRGEGGLAALRGTALKVLLGTLAALGALVGLRRFSEAAYAWCAGTVVFTLVTLAFAMLLVLVLESGKGSPLRAFFSGRFLQACGKYSYAMYILNIPVFMLLDHWLEPGRAVISGSRLPAILAYTAAGTLLSLAGALLTWHLLEKHCLKLKKCFVAGERVRPAGAPAT
jgi:peptidoglycan/LPS O-acetylase OafA/YrhL